MDIEGQFRIGHVQTGRMDSEQCWVRQHQILRITLLFSDNIIYAVISYGNCESFPENRSTLFPNVRDDILLSRIDSNQEGNNGKVMIEPLVLWGFEGSPFVRPVRETISSLGLPHIYINCGRGSANRDILYERKGNFQVPLLQDPNTGIEMFESGEIVKYLMNTYTKQLENRS